MDSRTHLDYAVFQLTPTRTRCDLVIFSGGINEKLASGLFQPFVSHLRLAKDENSKGGYSIRLCPPMKNSPWFTKATIQRFVRFVDSPEVLERFINIEKEISHIEHSFQESESFNTCIAGQQGDVANGTMKNSADLSKPQSESKETDKPVEENPRSRLQRILETRRALLRREQAMAYARALVVGFEVNGINDLISFADEFGASRLREAGINFKELCKKKQTDGLWMDELAAVQECCPSELSLLGTSGIVLANETNEPNKSVTLSFLKDGLSSSESKVNSTGPTSLDGNKDQKPPQSAQISSMGAVPWPSQIPYHMYSVPNGSRQMYPYPGYPLPSMQPIPPFYPSNMQWPPNQEEYRLATVQGSRKYRNRKSSSAKKNSISSRKESSDSEEDSQNESDDGDSLYDSDPNAESDVKYSSKEHSIKKKHKKKSSRTVVIRNINYITSKKGNAEKDVSSETYSSQEDVAAGSGIYNCKPDGKKHGQKSENEDHISQNGSQETIDNDLDASRGKKRNESWDVFQNLLLRDEETCADVVKVQSSEIPDEHYSMRSKGKISVGASHSEEASRKHNVADDSFMVTTKHEANESNATSVNFANGENVRPQIKGEDCVGGELLYAQRMDSVKDRQMPPCDNVLDISVLKKGRAEDWFVVNHSEKSEYNDTTSEHRVLFGDQIISCENDRARSEKSQKNQLIDDSFMVHARTPYDNNVDKWKTDISIVEDLSSTMLAENGNGNSSQRKVEKSYSHQPDDLSMVLEGDSRLESDKVPWTMECGLDISLSETDQKCFTAPESSTDEKLASNSNSTSKNKKEMPAAKAARSRSSQGLLAKSKSDIMSRTKKPSTMSRATVMKSKAELEEEIRKRMEELKIQRQKRIAERTAANCSTTAASKKMLPESKTVKASSRCDKTRTQSIVHGTNRISSHRQEVRTR